MPARCRRTRDATCVAWLLLAFLAPVAAFAAPLFNDTHFHLTNYIQEGPPLREFLDPTMGNKVGRVALFGIPLQQTWSYENSAQATDLYTRQCSINVNAKDLAVMAATLANGGVNPVTKKKVIEATHVPGILAVMATAGMYDDSGKWLFHAGLPAKSGVGGGIIAVSPGRFGIAAFSPPLDAAGNSVRAQKAITDVSNALGGNPYAPQPK